MTNSDRLQEIRERAEKATPGPWETGRSGNPYWTSVCIPNHPAMSGLVIADARPKEAEFIAASREDIPWLLQLVTEQQREMDRLQNYHEALSELKEHIEAIAAADKDKWKASGLEAVATMLRMWHIEGVQEMKQELRALKNPRKLKIESEQNPLEVLERATEAKGYRKQEGPI